MDRKVDFKITPKIEPKNLAHDFKAACELYRNDYYIKKNTHDRIVSIINSQIDAMMKSYGEQTNIITTALCCLLQALFQFLEKEESQKFLPRIKLVRNNHQLQDELDKVKNQFTNEIASCVSDLVKNSWFPFRMDGFVKRYTELNPSESHEKVYRIVDHQRLTQEGDEFFKELLGEEASDPLSSSLKR